MQFTAFQDRFPKIGFDECRFVQMPDGGDTIPPGTYGFGEYYCADSTCDCRRVMLVVTDARTGEQLASISFGFDRKNPLSGPFLDPINRQSAFADEFLELAQQLVLPNKDYVDRLQRHYRMFKAALIKEEIAAAPAAIAPVDVQARIAARKEAKQLLQRIQRQNKKRSRSHR